MPENEPEPTVGQVALTDLNAEGAEIAENCLVPSRTLRPPRFKDFSVSSCLCGSIAWFGNALSTPQALPFTSTGKDF